MYYVKTSGGSKYTLVHCCFIFASGAHKEFIIHSRNMRSLLEVTFHYKCKPSQNWPSPPHPLTVSPH